MAPENMKIEIESREIERAAYVLAQAAILNCRVAGMVAENQYREHLGQGIAYGADQFDAVEREFQPRIGHEAIANLLAAVAEKDDVEEEPPIEGPYRGSSIGSDGIVKGGQV